MRPRLSSTWVHQQSRSGRPGWALTAEQLAQLDDVNVLITQRVRRAASAGRRSRCHGCGATLSPSPARGGNQAIRIDCAVASLQIELTDDEATALEAQCTARYDFQGVSDNAQLTRISTSRHQARPVLSRLGPRRPCLSTTSTSTCCDRRYPDIFGKT